MPPTQQSYSESQCGVGPLVSNSWVNRLCVTGHGVASYNARHNDGPIPLHTTISVDLSEQLDTIVAPRGRVLCAGLALTCLHGSPENLTNGVQTDVTFGR